jgi:hypothetical protein
MRPGVTRFVMSPVRGRVSAIDLCADEIRIEPLLEEKEIRAWLPGRVTRVTERGCTVLGSGSIITGVWGSGREAFGPVRPDQVSRGAVTVTEFAGHDLLEQAREQGAAGVVCAGVNLVDVLPPDLGFTLVVLGGFGRQALPGQLRDLLVGRAGQLCLLDGLTQLRVGVRRPRVILPEA